MCAGATGGVGRRVVQRLLAAGKHVRALVRDAAKARLMLVRGGGLGFRARYKRAWDRPGIEGRRSRRGARSYTGFGEMWETNQFDTAI